MERIQNKIVLSILCLSVILSFAAGIIVNRNLIFDDSFISYRYAKNLAHGYGITWNVGEQPTEGYTNFLLVLVLAPFIKTGLDPLLVTRILSVLSAMGLSLLLFIMVKRYLKAEQSIAFVSALAFLISTNTSRLCTVGLETIIFAFFLFIGFYFAVEFMEKNRLRYLNLFGLSTFIAFLLRPEAIFMAIIFLIVIIIKEKGQHGVLLPMVKVLSMSLGLPLAIYLLWKLYHFGSIFPNSFYIKVTSILWYSSLGLESIITFFVMHSKLLLLTLLSVSLCKDTNWHNSRIFAILFICFYLLFYLYVDTLMDIGGRFLYPVIPFFFYLGVPAIMFLFRYLLNWKGPFLIKIPVICLIFFHLFSWDIIGTFEDIRGALRGGDYYADKNSLMQKEYIVAKKLMNYPYIRDISIAIGDAGVIPYFTEAYTIDTVGLNDSFISREKDIRKLTDYLFSKRPILIFQAANKNHSLITCGHGHLGDNTKWALDHRWDNYRYIATITTTMYNLHLFLRQDYKFYEYFSRFIKENIADIIYPESPLTLGSQRER